MCKTTIFPFIRQWLAVLSFLVAGAWHVLGIPSIHVVASEPFSKTSQQGEQPVENSAFVDVVVRCRVTQRFEIYNPHSAEQLGPLRSWTPESYESFVTLYRATDRIRLMPYPDLDEGPLEEVYFQMMRSRHLMKLAGRELPQVVILQTWVLPENSKLPTIDELRVMAYQAMLSGADTVSFFSYDPELWQKTPGFTTAFADLMQELTDFSRRFRTATVESSMNPQGVLTATLFLPGSSPVSVVVNTNRSRVQELAPLQVVVPTVQQSLVVVPTNPRRAWRGGPVSRRFSVHHRRFGAARRSVDE